MANIIPRPIKIKELGETVYFSKKTVISGEFSSVATIFESLVPDAKDATPNNLTFIIDNDIAEEGYKIVCDNGDINIFCSAYAGALYGFMSVVQLAAGNDSFKAVLIEDAPKYNWRGFMLDCSRHFWSMDKLKQILDYMASIKMNVFHWHLADDQGWRIEIKKYPLLTEKGAIRKGTPYSVIHMRDKESTYNEGEYGRGLFYTQEDAREIVRYAAERNIMVVPEIDVPGHATAAIACYPEISCDNRIIEVEPHFGIFKNNLCCAKKESYDFIKTVIDELCEIFPAPYFHIGGDEVVSEQWDNCPACQELMKKEGLDDHVALHGYFNNILVNHLKEKGKQTIGWNEIISDTMDSTAIPQVWTTRGTEKAVEWSKTRGPVILTQYNYFYSDMAFALIPLSKTYNYSPFFEGFEDENILGVEMPQWTEYIPNDKKFDFQTYVRLLAVSELGWTDVRNKHYEDFETRVETLRPYFKSIGINLAPKYIYCGNTFNGAENMTEAVRKEKGRFLWSRNPYYELELLDY